MDAKEIEKITESLKKLEPGFLPFSIFSEVARIMTMVTVEVIIFLKESDFDTPKILLLQRPADDVWWPNEWHVFGSILRATDTENTFKDAFQRIEEESDSKFIHEPIFLRNHFRKEQRGSALAIQYYVILKKKGDVGVYFDLNKLPSNIVKETKDLIEFAVEKLKL